MLVASSHRHSTEAQQHGDTSAESVSDAAPDVEAGAADSVVGQSAHDEESLVDVIKYLELAASKKTKQQVHLVCFAMSCFARCCHNAVCRASP